MSSWGNDLSACMGPLLEGGFKIDSGTVESHGSGYPDFENPEITRPVGCRAWRPSARTPQPRKTALYPRGQDADAMSRRNA